MHAIEQYLISLQRTVGDELEVHHGCCVGVDAQCNKIAVRHGVRTVGHPPENNSKMAVGLELRDTRPPAPYLVRDKHIVEETIHLIAIPAGYVELVRSGTWATVRMARAHSAAKQVDIIRPDGHIINGR